MTEVSIPLQFKTAWIAEHEDHEELAQFLLGEGPYAKDGPLASAIPANANDRTGDFYYSLRSSFKHYRRLTERQSAAARSLMERLRPASDADRQAAIETTLFYGELGHREVIEVMAHARIPNSSPRDLYLMETMEGHTLKAFTKIEIPIGPQCIIEATIIAHERDKGGNAVTMLGRVVLIA